MVVASSLTWPEVFRKNIVANARYWLERLEQADLSVDDRRNVLRALSYALELDAAWPIAHRLTLSLAPLMEQQGAWEEMAGLLRAAVEASRSRGDLPAQAAFLILQGNIYRLQSRLEQANQVYDRALELYRRLGDKIGQATALNRLAYSRRLQQNLPQAKELSEQALAHLPQGHPERAHSFHILSLVALDSRQWQDCLRNGRLALARWWAKGNRHLAAVTLLGMATALLRLKRYEEADRTCVEANEIFESLNDPLHGAIALNNRGTVYLDKKQFDRALAYFGEAERTFRRYHYKRGLTWVYNNLGIIYTQQKAWAEAERAYHSAIQSSRELKDAENTANCLDNLALMYKAKGDLKAAQQALQTALAELEQGGDNPTYDHAREVILQRLTQFRQESKSGLSS